MRRFALPILVHACCALILVQMTGVHLHTELEKHDDSVEHFPHLEQAFSSHHIDDSAHADVSVNEPAPTSFFKLDVFAAIPHVSYFAPSANWRVRQVHSEPIPVTRQNVYWRPHLRAPPPLV